MRVWIGGTVVLLALVALGWLLSEPNRDRAGVRRATAPDEPAARRVTTPDEPVSPLPMRRYVGSVHGPDGPVWGVGVHATVAESERRLGSTATDTRGEFELKIAHRDELVDLLVAPKHGTHLSVEFRPGCAPERHHRFVLEKWRIRGRLFGPKKRFRQVLPLLVLTASRYREIRGLDERFHPSRFRGSSLSSVSTDREGGFNVPGLPDGEYALVVDSDEWMLDRPVFFRPADGIEARVTPAFGLEFFVKDISTAEPVARFEARIERRDLPALRLAGRGGRVSFRFAEGSWKWAPRVARSASETAAVGVRAEGFVDASVDLSRLSRRHDDRTVWLWPTGEDNVELEVVYDDDGEWEGNVDLRIENQRVRQSVKLKSQGKGRFTGRLPIGEWEVTVTAWPGNRFRAPWSRSAEIVPGRTWKPEFVRARGGELHLDADSKSADVIRLVNLEFHDEESDRWASEPVRVRGAEVTLEDLPCGKYRIAPVIYGRHYVATPTGPKVGLFFNDGSGKRYQYFEIEPGSRLSINIDQR